MQGPPYFFKYQNMTDARLNPAPINAKNKRVTLFYQRYLLQKAISIFKWKLPETWSKNFLLYCLYCYGYVAVFNTDAFGTIFQPCGLTGFDVYYQPTNAIIANPLIQGSLQPRIGVQCELLRLQPDYGGIMDIVTHYAELMAIASETASINLFNSKLSYVFAAHGKSVADSFKSLFDKIAGGEPASVISDQLFNDDGSPAWQPFQQNLGQNYIADRILSDLRKIEAMYDTDIGIPNANTDKRERLITDEVNANNIETLSKCALWLEELKTSCEKVNRMFGLSLSVDWRFKVEEVTNNNGSNYNNPGIVSLG